MRVYMDGTVYEKAKERIEFCMQEFDEIVVGVSGGKDSQAVLYLTLEVAEAYGWEKPIYCIFVDQEMEYQATIDTMERWQALDKVELFWVQCEIHITNGAGHQVDTVKCWDPALSDDEYMRPKRDDAITENTYDTYDLKKIWPRVLDERLDGEIVQLAGLRAEESPNRYMGLTNSSTYKGLTYGTNTSTENIRSIYPVYDWSYSDVWKYIHDNDLEYNEIYDFQFRHGVSLHDMRVSHLHHQNAVQNLYRLQEFEPETFNKLVERVPGIHSTKQLGEEGILPNQLPFMFESWRDYRNYLTEKLIENEEDRNRLKKHFFRHDIMAEHLEKHDTSYCAAHVIAVMKNDVRDFDVFKQLRPGLSNPSARKARDQKIRWLIEERPDIWDELCEMEIVNDSYERTRIGLAPDSDTEPPELPELREEFTVTNADADADADDADPTEAES